MKICKYGTWSSTFDIRTLFERPSVPLFPRFHGDNIYWLQIQPAENGRTVLICRTPDGVETCLTPKGYSIRSRVHEYGGCSYTLADNFGFFVNDEDQCIYQQSLEPLQEPVAITASSPGSQVRYIDLHITHSGDFLICIQETICPNQDNKNSLVAISLASGEVCEIASGKDFYANPVIDSKDSKIAWVQWDHPYMPWDQSEAVMGKFNISQDEVTILDPKVIAGGSDSSVCQLSFDAKDRLLLIQDQRSNKGDARNFWNLYRYHEGFLQPLTTDTKEYGWPHWIFGDRRYVSLPGKVLACRIDEIGDELVQVKEGSDEPEKLNIDAVGISQLSDDGQSGILFIETGYHYSPRLSRWNGATRQVIKSNPELLNNEAISQPKAIRYPTGLGQQANAYFYPPCNPKYAAPELDLPPLLVMVHGGPTARSLPGLDFTRQYWTDLGFAVLDINYRGSTGYGREYRQSLLAQWGQYDTEDIVRGIDYVANQGWVNRNRVFIRGKSAGGYTVMCALTRYPEYFAGGACYYGIGNLVTLAQTTHKFEAKYTDRLIGEDFDTERAKRKDSLFYQRSPIHFVSKISCPLIIFQGLEDKVVPPSVSREIVHALRSRNLNYEYIEYSQEGHGFRSSHTNIDAIRKETQFYQKLLI